MFRGIFRSGKTRRKAGVGFSVREKLDEKLAWDFPIGQKTEADFDFDFDFDLERGGRFAGFSVREKLDEKLVWDFPFGKKLGTDDYQTFPDRLSPENLDCSTFQIEIEIEIEIMRDHLRVWWRGRR